jgi:predicted phage terminase large subunit-like protein
MADHPPKKTVEEWLNTVSYEPDPNYVPSEFALEFVSFIKSVNASIGGEENTTPIIHYKMLDALAGKKKNIANLCHRGAAKTSVMAEYLFLYIAVTGGIPGFGKVNFALYVSDSIENGVKNMRKNLEHRWENSDFLQYYLPKKGMRLTDVRYQFTNLDGHKFVVRGYGAQTGVRGAKEMGKRPTLAVMDDLISDEDARSPTVIAAIEDTVHKAVNFALHSSRSKRVWSGTPFNAKDPLYKVVESGAWWVNVYPVCEKFPCEREEFRGSWEDRFDYDYVKEQYDTALALGQIHSFNQELMLRIMSDEDRLITDDDIQWYSVESLMRARSNFNFYITTDFATSEETSADYSVIAVWALNNNRDWFLVDAIVKRQLMDKNVNDLFSMVTRYKPLEVGIEVSGQQRGFISWIKKEMLTRNIFFNLSKTGTKEGIQPTTDKITRFNVVVPWFKAKKMYFPKEAKNTKALIEFMDELGLATIKGFKSKHDDCIDTISMLALINAWEPSYVSPSVHYKKRTSDPTPPEPWGMYGSTDIDTFDYEEESGLSGYLG